MRAAAIEALRNKLRQIFASAIPRQAAGHAFVG
jgi:hypothetical protein